MKQAPQVSVIIPAYNSQDDVKDCLDSLSQQSYPESKYEIIVVDNGSSDRTTTVASSYPIKLLREETQGSYVARNTGIESANGDILAFIDSDCVATPNWIEAGVQPLIDSDADLVGGKVAFTHSSPPNAAEYFDSITNMQIRDNIEARGVAKTANLFVCKEVFDTIGKFPEGLKSGGDVEWTGKATDQEYDLVYAPKAEVYHPARKFRPLMKKQFRVGRGQIQVWQNEGRSNREILRSLIRGFLPMLPSTIAQRLEDNEIEYGYRRLVRIWFVAWCSIVSTNVGRITRQLLKNSER